MSQTQEECVLKRNGFTETVSFDKILKRIKTLGDESGGLSLNYTTLCRKIIDQLYNKIPINYKKRIKVCVDTCHIYVSGYNISSKDGEDEYFNKFNKLIGMKNLKFIH